MKAAKEEVSGGVQQILTERLERIRRKKNRIRLLRGAAVTFLLVFISFGILFGIGYVEGDSMYPALHDGDVVLFWRLVGNYRSGDIVLLDVNGRGKYNIKRIIGLPGQTVDIEKETGLLKVEGVKLTETYIFEETFGKAEAGYPIRLGREEYFVLGDQRGNSVDSRNYGMLDRKQILGRVIAVWRMGV